MYVLSRTVRFSGNNGDVYEYKKDKVGCRYKTY